MLYFLNVLLYGIEFFLYIDYNNLDADQTVMEITPYTRTHELPPRVRKIKGNMLSKKKYVLIQFVGLSTRLLLANVFGVDISSRTNTLPQILLNP